MIRIVIIGGGWTGSVVESGWSTKRIGIRPVSGGEPEAYDVRPSVDGRGHVAVREGTEVPPGAESWIVSQVSDGPRVLDAPPAIEWSG